MLFLLDFDECAVHVDECAGVSHCLNDIGSYHCVCPGGYNLTTGGRNCEGNTKRY